MEGTDESTELRRHPQFSFSYFLPQDLLSLNVFLLLFSLDSYRKQIIGMCCPINVMITTSSGRERRPRSSKNWKTESFKFLCKIITK